MRSAPRSEDGSSRSTTIRRPTASIEGFSLEGERVFRWDGREVGTGRSKDGYLLVKLQDGRLEYFHRIKFALANGWWPPRVDHWDGDNRNNALENLKASDGSRNAHNRKSSGRGLPRGVIMSRNRRNPYRANVRGKYLGYYRTPEEASAVVEDALKGHYGEAYSERGLG